MLLLERGEFKRLSVGTPPSTYTVGRVKSPRVAKVKNGYEPKTCVRCGLPFEWRKKWARDWDSVKYCSDKCRDNK